jgi:hypothetical protein
MTNYKLGAFIKMLQKYPENTYFQCPNEIFCISSKIVPLHIARRNLALISIYWNKQNIHTTFHIWGEGKSDIWDKDNLRKIEVNVIKISADNEKIQEFASSLNTCGD